ncbi:LuxR C-terminal-related transcriptional regulator [Paenibacillus sp. J22TS3]|uniref:LuxR C-terminal-related transcriptional regulator n=1 Tax=Paenibacillus sp. J22TS3 TaxID=2807192 RepID=UPI001B096EB2|nr:LuxR C-terminal-related transcriptional regulator [Paenibacillus sp. J22TS3]GIP23265.1 LuxR family transcriptional regulator [Paenibacillus sp. J22TS3]
MIDHPSAVEVESEEKNVRRHWLDFMIIPSKFEIPPIPASYVKRQRLHKKLRGALRRRLTLIEGPPGSGKTTLVSGWKEEAPAALAYITLEEADNHLLRFWLQVIAAMDQAVPGTDEGLTIRFIEHFVQQPSRALAELNAMCAQLSEPLILVIDGYHTIEIAEIHLMLTDWLYSLPEQLHIILITHSEIPLKLPKQLVYKIGWPELAFSVGEIKRLYQKLNWPAVTREQALQLQKETEGWALGLHMLSTIPNFGKQEGETSQASLENSILDKKMTVCGRMMDQLMSRLAPESVSFLMRTVVPERINESLIRDLTESPDPEQLLADLENEKLLFQRIREGSEVWYRYHPLIAQKLRNLLQEQDIQQWCSLQRTTGTWLENNGFPMEAMEHYMRGGHYDEAGRLLEVLFNQFILREAWTLRRFFAKIPEETMQKRPKLYLSSLFFTVGEQGPQRTLEQLDSVEWKIAAGQGELSEAQRAYAMRVIKVMRAYVCIFKQDLHGLVFHLNDYLDQGYSPQDEIFSYIDYQQRHYSRLRSFPGITGRLLPAEHCFEPIMRRWSNIRSYNTGYYAIGYGELMYEHNRMREAEEAAALARSIGEELGADALIVPAAILQSRIAFSRKQLQSALQILSEVRAGLSDKAAREWSLILDACETKLHLQSPAGDPVAGLRYLSSYSSTLMEDSTSNELLVSLVLARALIFNSQDMESRPLLKRILKIASGQGLIMEQLEAYVLLALLYSKLGKDSLAARTFGKAVQLSAREGHLRTYLDEGAALRKVAEHYRQSRQAYKMEERQVSVRYIDQILFAFEAQDAPTDKKTVADRNPLSDMERRVLLGVSKRWTSKEIAGWLGVSTGTVHTYIQRIFSKLEVNKRKEAVLKAYRSGWLDTE